MIAARSNRTDNTTWHEAGGTGERRRGRRATYTENDAGGTPAAGSVSVRDEQRERIGG